MEGATIRLDGADQDEAGGELRHSHDHRPFESAHFMITPLLGGAPIQAILRDSEISTQFVAATRRSATVKILNAPLGKTQASGSSNASRK